MASQHPRDARPSPAARLSRWLSEQLSDLQRRLRGPYHPELHDRRGPGPRWGEKQSSASRPGPASSP